MFRYDFQHFGFKEKHRYVFNQAIDGRIKHMKTNLELLGLDNLIQNVH